jgi:hypothetical protein
MRAAADADDRGLLRMEQCQHDRLQHQRTTAGTADREMVVAAPDGAGRKAQLGGAKLGTCHARAADLGGGLHRHQVLPHQAGFRAVGPDIADPERLPGNHGQRERAAHYLAAAFAGGAVEFNHRLPAPLLFLFRAEGLSLDLIP